MECLDPALWPSGLKGSDSKSNDVEVCGESVPGGPVPSTPSGPCGHTPVSPPAQVVQGEGPVPLPVHSLLPNPLQGVGKPPHTPSTPRAAPTAVSFPP